MSFEIWLNHQNHLLSILFFSSISVDGILSIGNKSDLRLTELATGESRLLADFGGGPDGGKEMTFAAAVACEGRIVLGMRNDYVHCYKASDD